ncbi:hypothetical protein BC941DRAFT_443726 [Chlamydoabsidia padenii]|nr:hypothetical protein BC941DRAFT_443726 [Chlamydoabsidia padenii]
METSDFKPPPIRLMINSIWEIVIHVDILFTWVSQISPIVNDDVIYLAYGVILPFFALVGAGFGIPIPMLGTSCLYVHYGRET